MKKSLLFISSLFAGITLSACGGSQTPTYNYGENYLAIVNSSYSEDIVYLPVKSYNYSLVESTKNKWVGDASFPRYTFDRYNYSNNDEFVDDIDKINDYINNHDFDSDDYVTSGNSGFIHHKTWYIYVNLTPIDYSVAYTGLEGSTHPEYPSTYNANMREEIKPVKKYYTFMGWEITSDKGSNVYPNWLFTYPYDKPSNIVMNARWEETKYKVNYTLPSGVTNPNTLQEFTHSSSSYDLLNLSNTKYYTFKGWLIKNGDTFQSVTTIDPSLYDSDILLVADIEYIDFSFKYMVDGSLYKEETYNIETFNNDYQLIAVPDKEHYDGKWDISKIEELDNYTINAIYTPKKYTISFVTNISGYNIEPKELTYGTTYGDVYDSITYPTKGLIGIYKDANFKTLINKDDIIDSSITVYLKWQDIIHITNVEEFNNISNDKNAYYILDNDIDFYGSAIPRIDNFGGSFDGNGHKITGFINQHVNTGESNALIINNNGVIKNVTFSQGMYTSTGAGHSTTCNQSFLTVNNNGSIQNIIIEECSFTLTPYYSVSHAVYVTGRENGGVFAANNNGKIINVKVDSESTVNFTSKIYKSNDMNYSDSYMRIYASFGGVAGNNSGTIENAEFDGQINSNVNWTESLVDGYSGYIRNNYYPLNIGGIVGTNNENATIIKSKVTGTVASSALLSLNKNSYPSINTGGIAGSSSGRIQNSLCDGGRLQSTCSGNTNVGGITGINEATGAIHSSLSTPEYSITHYSTNNLYVGGLTGVNKGSVAYSGVNAYKTITLNNTSKTNNYFASIAGHSESGSSIVRTFGVYNRAIAPYETLNYSEFTNGNASTLLNYAYVVASVKESFVIDETYCKDIETIEEIYSDVILKDKLGLPGQGITLNENAFPSIDDVGYQNI